MEGHETWVVEGLTDQSVDSWNLLQLCLADYKLLFPGHAQNSRQDHSNDKQLLMILQASFLLCKTDAQLTDSATCNLHLQELTFCNMMLWLKNLSSFPATTFQVSLYYSCDMMESAYSPKILSAPPSTRSSNFIKLINILGLVGT
jgi:hypothetical protein